MKPRRSAGLIVFAENCLCAAPVLHDREMQAPEPPVLFSCSFAQVIVLDDPAVVAPSPVEQCKAAAGGDIVIPSGACWPGVTTANFAPAVIWTPAATSNPSASTRDGCHSQAGQAKCGAGEREKPGSSIQATILPS